jgi:hypothetical protein
MVNQSPTPPAKNNAKSDNRHGSNAVVTQEQVRAIADRVYRMLLRDLQQERERDRSTVWNSRTFKRG